MDPNLLEEELKDCDRRKKLPRAVVAVDILGHSVDMGTILEIASRYELPVVEDAAQALGSTYKDRSAGTGGWAGTFSFNGNKIITTSSGGMICTDDDKLAEQARFFAAQSRDSASFYLHSQIGFNYGFSNVLAAIGLQLAALDQRVAQRRRLRDIYRRELEGPPGNYLHTGSQIQSFELLVDVFVGRPGPIRPLVR